MTNTLPTDRYYRGYRLSIHNEGQADMEIHIFYGSDHVDTVYAIHAAKTLIDSWQAPR